MKKFSDFIEKTVVESLKDSVEKSVECKLYKIAESIDKSDIDEQLFTQTEIESVKPPGKFFVLLEKKIAEALVADSLTDETLEDLMFQFSFDFSARYDEITEAQMGWQVSSSSMGAKIDDSVLKGDYILMNYDITVGDQKGKWLWIIPKQYADEIASKLPDDQIKSEENSATQSDNKVAEPDISGVNNAELADKTPPQDQGYDKIRNLDILMDVKLRVVVRVGTKTMLLKDVLKLVPGKKIIFSQNIDDPLDILVNEKVVAKGKVVSVDGYFGIKITSIESKHSRLNKLR